VDRDFDYYRLIGQDVSVLAQLNEMGKISDSMLLEILRRGEILPDTINVEDEVAAAAASKESTETPDSEDESDEITSTNVDRLIELLAR
jgi:hypothetical protein